MILFILIFIILDTQRINHALSDIIPFCVFINQPAVLLRIKIVHANGVNMEVGAPLILLRKGGCDAGAVGGNTLETV